MTDIPVGLRVRKLAVDDGLERVQRFDPLTGEKFWASPSTGEPLPKQVKGVVLDTDVAPPAIRISQKFVGAADWIEQTHARVVHKPAGPAEDPWRATHTFVHCDELVLHLLDGDVRYRVTRQPDKYDTETDEPSDLAGDPTTYVVHDYVAELVED